MKLVRTWCKIPTKDAQTIGEDLTLLQALIRHKELREEWSTGRNRWKPTNYVLQGYVSPWSEGKVSRLRALARKFKPTDLT
jgi:hypothetical protein